MSRRSMACVVVSALLVLIGGCSKKGGSGPRREKSKSAVPSCEEVCKRASDCEASRIGAPTDTQAAHEATLNCVYECNRTFSDGDRRCWMTTVCSNIPSGGIRAEKCPEWAKELEAKRLGEKADLRKECEPKIAALAEVVAEAESVGLTHPILDGLRCVTTVVEGGQRPTEADLFPELKERLARARDAYERDEIEAKFRQEKAAEIREKYQEWEKAREDRLAPLRAALKPTYWFTAPATVRCEHGGCDVVVKDIPGLLYKFPFKLGGTYDRKPAGGDPHAHPLFYQPEAFGLPPQRFGVASAAIAKQARQVDEVRIVFRDSRDKGSYFEPDKYRFCVNATRSCSGWIDSPDPGFAYNAEETEKEFSKAMTGKWEPVK